MRALVCALGLLYPVFNLLASDAVILVEDAELYNPAAQSWSPAELGAGFSADGGALLRNIPGVSGARMGGRGIDPIIRGQSQNRLNILLDGAYVHGGCPNRMDPPSTYASRDSYDRITVIKGSQTVIYGGGGPGGTVLFERYTPRFNPDEAYRIEASAGYQSNSGTREFAADVAAGDPDWFLRGIATYMDANNYQDGDGNTVRSAFTNQEGALILGYTPSAATRLELSYDASREEDVLFAGAGMDSPSSDNDTLRLKFASTAPAGIFTGLKTELYSADIDHLMDNYSLRPLTAPMKMRVPSTSNTGGGRVSGEIQASGGVVWTIGLDYQDNNRNANRFSGMPAGPTPATLQSILWPDADLRQTGLFAETRLPITARDSLKAGVRYDFVDAEAGRAGEVAQVSMGLARSPAELYALYYGAADTSTDENNVGGFITLEHALAEDAAVYATLSRSMRTADATERYIASDNAMAADMRWIGNPGLEPEQHHQLELGYTRDAGRWDASAAVFYNDVTDYILRDRARTMPDPLNDGATIYRNVGATFYGFEAEAGVRWASHWSSRASLAYVRAENTDDDRPIAQTPPLEITLNLEYTRNDWNLGGMLRAQDNQQRVEDDVTQDSGLDARQTPGWATLDVYGSYTGTEHMTLAAGINNIFDRSYAYHVNRANVDPFNPDAVQVNEPGREVWLRLSATF
ncbi:MAG: TonB-dependent copper receptor [Gammaproteobacteria bacterium]